MDTSYNYMRSYQSSSSSDQIQFLGAKKWQQWSLLFLSFVNVFLLASFTILDIVKRVERQNLDTKFAFDIESNITDFPALIVEDMTYWQNNPSFTFDLVVILTIGFVSVLLLYGLLTEKKYEIFLSVFIMIVILCLMTAEVADYIQWALWYKKLRVISAWTLTLLTIPLAMKTVSEDNWMEFRVAGTSDGIMDLYRRLKFFNALLHLDFFAVCLLALFNLRFGLGSSFVDVLLMVIVLMYGALCLVIGSLAVNKEIKKLVFVFLILAMILPIWLPIEVYRSCCFAGFSDCSREFLVVFLFTVTSGILALIVRTYVIVELLKVYRNFGYGLTDTAFVGLVFGESSSLLARPRR